jgi:hypothetical protein
MRGFESHLLMYLSMSAPSLSWEGPREGRTVRLFKEPDTSWWARVKLTFLGWLPIEGQL